MFIYDISKVATQLESQSNLESLEGNGLEDIEINSPYIVKKGRLILRGRSAKGNSYQCLLQEGSVIVVRENKDYQSENNLVDKNIAKIKHVVEVHTAIVYTKGVDGKRKPHVQTQKAVYVNLAELKNYKEVEVSDLYEVKINNERILKILKSSLV